MLEVMQRAITGRATRLWFGSMQLDTPNILFLDSPTFPAPDLAELLLLEREEGYEISAVGYDAIEPPRLPKDLPVPMLALMPCQEEGITEGKGTMLIRAMPDHIRELVTDDGYEICSLGTSFELRRDARYLVRSIVSLRQAVGPTRLIHTPGIMDVGNLALLVYLGVDLFDSSLLIYLSSRGCLSLPEGTISADEADWLVPSANFEDILEFNYRSAMNELRLVRMAIRSGSLRELVETRIHSDPWAVAALRIFDIDYYDFQERQATVAGGTIRCNSRESLLRPDVRRFKDRLIERYRPPGHKRILLLLPCSARKPYSTSRSHRILQRAIRSGVRNSRVVHEVIVTSPLGVVPRELEVVYPAAHYDIPVTGHWDCYEVEMIQSLVRHFASMGYEHVVFHDGTDFVRDVVEGVDTAQGDPLTSEALDRLIGHLGNLCGEMPWIGYREDLEGEMLSLARFQFGEAGEQLMRGTSVAGRYPRLRITDGETQLGMLTPERGWISLTLEGAERLAERGYNLVTMGDFELKGNLFAVGVQEADPRIRIGEETIVVRGGQVQAVGVASMNGEDMVALRRGEAVRVRHARRQ